MFCVARYSLAEIWRSKRSCTVPLAGWVARFARARYADPNPKVYFFTFALIHVAHPLNSRRRVKEIHLRPHSSNSPKCPPLSSWFLAGPSSARHFRPLVQKSVSPLFFSDPGPWQLGNCQNSGRTQFQRSPVCSPLLSNTVPTNGQNATELLSTEYSAPPPGTPGLAILLESFYLLWRRLHTHLCPF